MLGETVNPLQAIDLTPGGASDWAQFALFLTTIAGFIFQGYRENRNHKWTEQRRERIAAELQAKVEATAVKLRLEAEETALAVKQQVEVESQVVKAQVEAEALAVKAQMEATEATVKRQADAHAVQVARALRENTEITQLAVAEAQNAYHEANNSNKRQEESNAKIEEIKKKFEEVLRLAALQREEQVDHIQETTDDTNAIVRARLATDADADGQQPPPRQPDSE